MTSKPLVSVCIPAFNQPDLLRRGLDSTLEQSFQEFEVLVLDDSDTDQVQQIVPLLAKDQRVIYLRNESSLGPAQNWNKAMAHARGSFIKFLHHDDWFARPDALQRFVETAESSGSGFVFSASNAIDSSGIVRSENRPSEAFRRRLLHDPAHLLATGNLIGGPSATMFRSDRSISFDEHLRWLVDVDFYITYLQRHRALAYIDDVMINTMSGEPHQVTAASFGNLAVEVNEWDLVYRKHRPRAGLGRTRKMHTLARHYGADNMDLVRLSDAPLATWAVLRLGAFEGRLLRTWRSRRGRPHRCRLPR